MSNINSQAQDLYAIVGVESLDNQTAAACNGGAISIFDKSYLKGNGAIVNGPTAKLPTKFKDHVASISIGGAKTWTFYTKENFQGNKITLTPGTYQNVVNFPIESLKPNA